MKNTMKRINLVIDGQLYNRIKKDAEDKKMAESALIMSILKEHFNYSAGTDYNRFTDEICEKIAVLPAGTRFTLSSFLDRYSLSIISIESGTSSQAVKSRLGKLLRKAINEGKAGNVALTGKKVHGGHEYIRL